MSSQNIEMSELKQDNPPCCICYVQKANKSIEDVSVALKEVEDSADKSTKGFKKFYSGLIISSGILKSFASIVGSILKTFKTILTLPAQIAKNAAPKVEKTITFLLSYMSEIFPTGNWETAPEIANKNVTIDISKIVKFIEVA